MAELKNKTIVITGASRGIGRAIALKCAQDGANIVVIAKTAEPNPKLPGTIYSVAEEIEALGGKALPIALDIRDADKIEKTVALIMKQYNGIDALVNNAGALSMTNTLATPLKRFDLLLNVNVRATFAMSQTCVPHLKKSNNPHILNISPPLNIKPKWFKDYLPYTISKYGSSMCTMGMAAEFASNNIAVNSLWPAKLIATAAIKNNFPPNFYARTRKPEIMADAAYAILTRNSSDCTGNFFLDEQLLESIGITDFAKYATDESAIPLDDAYTD